MRRLKITTLAILVSMSPTSLFGNTPTNSNNDPFWTGHPDATAFEKTMAARLANAQAALDRLLAVKGKRTIENTLKPYDEILVQLDAAGAQAALMEVVHPDKSVRDVAEKVTQKVSSFNTLLSLNRAVYDALLSLDVSNAEPTTRYYVERTLRDFRLAGVDKDEATRARIKSLRDELVLIGQDFDKNIRSDVRTLTVKDVAELEGLPADY